MAASCEYVRHINCVQMCLYIYIWVILLKIGQNCDIEGKNSKREFFNVIIWK